MYCTKCGKEIESGIICDDCIDKEREQAIAQKSAEAQSEQTVFESVSEAQAEQTVFESVSEEPAVVALDETLWQPAHEVLADTPSRPVNDSPMLGFGRALASTIMGVLASIFGAVAYIFAIMGDMFTESDPEQALAVLIAAVILNVVFTLPLGIISLVMGARSISLFKKTLGKKPIATLVLGIIGTYHAVGAFVMLIESLFYL